MLSLPPETSEEAPYVSTGHIPPPEEAQRLVEEAYDRYRDVKNGTVADYIPALASVSPDLFGICVVGVAGRSYGTGDTDVSFSIQSVSKPFLFALICDLVGHEEARAKLGVNSTGMAFNSVLALELSDDRTGNPMVNAGAIATTSLVPGRTIEDKWEFIHNGLSRFAGRSLSVNDDVYTSETDTNGRNGGLALLLESYGKLYCEADVALDLYTRQCSLEVTVRDLAAMGATLADGGVNPLTGEAVVSAQSCWRTLAVLATAGLYEQSGDWLYEIGLPGKSGVSGSIVTVSPGKGALATFSPPLDSAGNSVRGQLVARFLSDRLGLNLFASQRADIDRTTEAAQNDQISGT